MAVALLKSGIAKLEDCLDEKETELKRKEEQQEIAEIKAQVVRDIAISREKEAYDEKYRLALDILGWTGHFSCLDEYARIQKVSTDSHGVYIFGDGWGHRVSHEEGHGCWSRVYVLPKGSIRYFTGWKWAGGSHTAFSMPEELATGLNHHYLSELWQELKTGKVYENIKTWHFKR